MQRPDLHLVGTCNLYLSIYIYYCDNEILSKAFEFTPALNSLGIMIRSPYANYVAGAGGFVECGYPSPYCKTPSDVFLYIGTEEDSFPTCLPSVWRRLYELGKFVACFQFCLNTAVPLQCY